MRTDEISLEWHDACARTKDGVTVRGNFSATPKAQAPFCPDAFVAAQAIAPALVAQISRRASRRQISTSCDGRLHCDVPG
jgi:hypothetical protein